MNTEHQRRVEKFMAHAAQDVPGVPVVPSLSVRELRARLILEEALETITALGFIVVKSKKGDGLEVFASGEPNLIEIVDGCADVSVVTIGTLSACGVHDAPILELVDNNNLAKFGPGSHRRKDGKWEKPPGHKPPDILEALRAQRYVGE